MQRLEKLVRKKGALFMPSLIIKVLIRLLDRVTTLYYRMQLASLGNGSVVQFGAKIENPRQVHLGDGVLIQRGVRIGSENLSGRLRIEDNVSINRGVLIDHTGNVIIESGALLSEGCVIYSHSHGLNPRSDPTPVDKRIGRAVWIGFRAIVLESCTEIGDGVVIGAGATVARSLDKSGVYVGAPIRNIR